MGIVEVRSLRRSPAKHIELLPQDQVFRFQRCSRLEARGQDTENQLEQIGHQDASLRRPLAGSTPNRIFGTHRGISPGIAGWRAGARSASGAACRWARSCAASAPTFRPATSISNASMAIRPASTWPACCNRRPFWRSISRKSRWRRNGAHRCGFASPPSSASRTPRTWRRLRSPTSLPAATGRTRAMTGSLAFDGAVGNAIGSLIRNRSLSRSGDNILRSGDAAEAQMMTDWLCRQGEHGKIELEDTQTAVEMLRGMMVMDTQRAVMLGQRAVGRAIPLAEVDAV